MSTNGVPTEDCIPALNRSRMKLDGVANALSPFVAWSVLTVLPCEKPEDCESYRSKCSFQIITCDDDYRRPSLSYAVREKGRPVPITRFPEANQRIQTAMKEFLRLVNSNCKDSGEPELSPSFSALKENVSSASFSSSWLDTETSDCVLTLNYHTPIEKKTAWLEEAQQVCRILGLSQLTGRSRGFCVRVCDGKVTTESTALRDCLHLRYSYDTSTWAVEVVGLVAKEAALDNNTHISVHYQKPEGAFFHPNARAMSTALSWILNRTTDIAKLYTGGKKPALLELYSGCGAHTIPLAKSGLLSSIIAVELDHRLVSAFRRNCKLNGLEESAHLRVICEDAGKWVKDCEDEFDILLVDPPRDGLHEKVREIAIHGNFNHILYISCGKEALIRDLETLNGAFGVVDCFILDLFPGTHAVESLVRMERRK